MAKHAAASPMKRILLIRPSAMGDIVMASPVVDALRRSRPDAFIAWLADPVLAPLLAHHPGLDRVVPWSRSRWSQLARGGRWPCLAGEIRALRATLHACRFDTAIDLQGLLRSRLLALLSGAATRIGFASKEPGEWLMNRIEDKGPDDKRMGSEYRYLMDRLGIPADGFAPRLVLSEAGRTAGAELLARHGVRPPYGVLCPFTTRPQKHWVEDRWAPLAAALHRRFGWPSVLLGGPGDGEAARRIAAAATTPLANLAGAAPIEQSAAVVEGADLLVGVDTGLTHMGTAFGRATVALFGPTCPYLRTTSPATRVLHHPHECSPCRRSPTCRDYRCMAGIGLDEVVEAAAELRDGTR